MDHISGVAFSYAPFSRVKKLGSEDEEMWMKSRV